MAKEKTKTQSETKKPMIEASCELWAEFAEWMRVQSCKTLPEGLRAAMRHVTGFGQGSQQKIA